VPVEVKEQVGAVGNFSSRHLLGVMRQKGGYGLPEAGRGRVHFWGSRSALGRQGAAGGVPGMGEMGDMPSD